jgi:hypothetical protein
MSPSALDVYDFYLDPQDLKGQSHAVVIEKAQVVPIYDPQLKTKVPRIVLTFVNRKKKMPLNKTQVGALIEILGTDDYNQWAKVEITLTPAMASNRKDTIAITSKNIQKESDHA